MSVSPEEKKRYFQETAIALRREGFRIEPSVGGRLGVWLDDHPICEVDQIGGITYRSDNILTPEYVAAKDKAYRMRFEDGGILVGHGYVAQHADLKQVYNTLILVPKKPDYAFRLLIGRYPFDTNDQPDKLVPLALPATPDELADALNACGAASWDEVVFQAEDSAVPHILEELDCDGIEEINELAQAIQYRAKRSELTKLKAVLHASDCHSIHAATYIAENLDDYLYEPDQRTPEEVATEELCFIVDEQSLPLLKKHADLFYYGRDIIAEANAKPQLQRDLDAVMGYQPIDEDAAQKLILSIAAAQYSTIGSDEYETARLQRAFSQCQPMTELDAEILRSTVSAIQIYSDGSLDIRLKNNQIIGRSETT